MKNILSRIENYISDPFRAVLLYVISLIIIDPYAITHMLGFLCITFVVYPRIRKKIEIRKYSPLELMLFSFLPLILTAVQRKAVLLKDFPAGSGIPGPRAMLVPSIMVLIMLVVPFIWRMLLDRSGLKDIGFVIDKRLLLLTLLGIAPTLLRILFMSGMAPPVRPVSGAGAAAAVFRGFIYIALLEEFYYRGFLFPAFLGRFSRGWAVVLSGAVYLLSHWRTVLIEAQVGGVGHAVFYGMAVLIFHASLCKVYRRSGSLIPGIAVHGLIDNYRFFGALLS